MIGKRLLHYEIVEKLGQGGMGVVYKAYDKHLDRFIALKLLPLEQLMDASRKRRFIQEAKAASALNHPNIVVVYDVATEDGTDFIAMEYVSGKTLDRLIPSHGMPVQQALKIAVQISDALSRAHSVGIVHRDLKPSNVMVDEHGRVKVLDFGLAKVTEHKTSSDGSTESIKTNTSEGAIVGTVAYMSPEQAEGKPVDARSDIFSFGEVLYEMLSGRRAFRGGTNMSTLAAIINSPPQPLEGVPPELAHVVDRCLKKDPARRFQHIDDVTVALDELREESQSGSQLPKHPGRRRRSLWVGAAAVITVVAAGLWLYTRTTRPPAEVRESVLPLTTYRGDEEFPSFSPDGAQVAFVWNGERGDNSDIYVKSVKADKPLRITTDPRPEVSPAWSPDGRYIAFLRQVEPMKVACYVVPPSGGAEMKIGEVNGQISVVFRGLAWLADSRRLLVGVMASASWHSTGLQGLRVLSIESDTQETWTRPEGTRGQDVSPAVSPDGRHIAFARVLDFDQSEILVMDVPAPGARPAPPKRVGLRQPGAADPLWTRDGRELIFTVGFSAAPSFWRAELSRPAAARQIQITGSNVVQPSLSWTANRLAYATWFLPRPDIWRVALSAPGVAAAAPEIWIASSQSDQDPAYSPDGSLIAFESSRSGTAELWIVDKNGGNPLQITSLGTRPNSPVWSPDGRQIAFRCRVEGQEEVCVTSALGGAVRTLTHNPAQDRPESWSPDGKWVHFSSNRSGRPETWRVPAAGGEAEFVSAGSPCRLSADGRTRFRVDPATYWVTAEPATGGPVEKLVGPLSTMGNWVPTTEGIYFIPRSSDRRYALMYYDFRARTAHEVAHLVGTPGWGIALSPDQRSLLFTMSENAASGSDLMLVENFR